MSEEASDTGQPPAVEEDPLRVVDVARRQFERALRLFSAWIDDIERQALEAGPDEVDGPKRMKLVTAAMQTMLEENGRFHGILDKRGYGYGSGIVLDLDAARAEIASRLDRLRRTGDEVSGGDG